MDNPEVSAMLSSMTTLVPERPVLLQELKSMVEPFVLILPNREKVAAEVVVSEVETVEAEVDSEEAEEDSNNNRVED